jgi:peptide/nickel transport system substrate-binding protein
MGAEDRGLEASGRSRRAFLREAATASGALVAGPAFLAACDVGGEDSASKTTAAANPKRGGALRIGVSGGGGSDTLHVYRGATNADSARLVQMYEWLAERDHDYKLKPFLGTEFTPNAAGDEMTVKLRQGVTFHNGKPFTAEDVIFSFKMLLDPKVRAGLQSLYAPFLDPSGMEALDTHTVRFKFKRPFNDFMDFVAVAPNAGIVPVGYDPNNPVGTGPFKLESFTPGQQSVFTRNEDYWGEGPYVDSVTIINLTDEAARVNALVSGAVDAIDSVPFPLLPSVQSNSNLVPLISKTGNWYPITMRVDRAPFNDVRVRQAFRLIVDRPEVVQRAYGGQAQLGNDLFSQPADPLYNHDLPQRVQDIEQAKFLLKQAGQEGLTVQLVTAPIQNGVVNSCVVFAEQAKEAGVNVQLTKLDNTTFYNDQYLQRTFSVDWWTTNSFLVTCAYSCVPDAVFNDTHWDDPQFTKLYYEVLATQDPELKQEIANEMQKQLWNEGGELIPGLPNGIDAFSKKVTGFVPDRSGIALSGYRFKQVSFV